MKDYGFFEPPPLTFFERNKDHLVSALLSVCTLFVCGVMIMAFIVSIPAAMDNYDDQEAKLVAQSRGELAQL